MNVLVTGASSGIGLEIVRKFLNMRHTVWGLDVRGPEIDNLDYTHHICDVSDAFALPPLPPIQILVNNAGCQEAKRTNASGRDMDVNFWGTVYCTEKYGIHKGIRSIVNIASASAHSGAEFPVYAASKGAVVTYTKTTALFIAQWGATCNSISPGAVITPMNARIVCSPKLYVDVCKESLLDRWANADEIAEWAYFLAVTNRSMTAQDILIDNGEMAKQNFVW